MADEQRVIELYPHRPPGQRWDGTVQPDPAAQPRHWCGGSVENVVKAMEADLGPMPDQDYRIVEGGT